MKETSGNLRLDQEYKIIGNEHQQESETDRLWLEYHKNKAHSIYISVMIGACVVSIATGLIMLLTMGG